MIAPKKQRPTPGATAGLPSSATRGIALAAGVLLLLAASPSFTSAQDLREVIDARITAAWQREKITSASPSDDATFLRRVHLDLVGTIPTHDEAKAFLDDKDANKRAKLIDRLLADPRYAQHRADLWDMVYFGRSPPGYDAPKRAGFQRWLREQFAKNAPYDQIARAMLKAEGNTAEQGSPMYLVQYARKPADAAVSVSQVFLGVQLQCARCHDHPFEDWTQLDFYGLAAFFARLRTVKVGKADSLDKIFLGEMNTGEVEFTGPAIEDEPGKKGQPVGPKFLLASKVDDPPLPKDFKEPRNFPSGKAPPKPKFSRKDRLAEWITAADNPYFARAVANRVWAQLMGRGIVHPVDNMSPANKPTHPELLEALAKGLIEHKFDLKWLIREIVSSKTYQLGDGGEVVDATPRWFERARVRPLSAEELAGAWRVATDHDAADAKTAERLKKNERFYPLTSGYMLRYFGTPANGVGDFQGGLHEHLYLNNGELGRVMSSGKGGLHHALVESKDPWPARVERLYLSILSRRPSDAEREKFVEYLSAEQRPHDRVKEAMWALMTSSEFRFNH